MAALVAALDGAHLDALLVTSLANIRYLTGFSGTSALLLVTARDGIFVTDFRYATQAVDEVGNLARVSVQGASLWAGFWQLLAEAPGVRVVGFESAELLHRDFQRLLEAGARWQWRPTTELVEVLRERKDDDEVAAIRRAGAIATDALGVLVEQVRAGMTEYQIAGVLEHALRDAGSEGFPFPTIVASGPRAALPHARTSDRALAPGDLLLVDFGAIADGYCSDITRTFCVGRASSEQRDIHAIVEGARAVAATGVRVGQRGRDADALARDYIDRHGYGDRFQHSLGHGVGLEVHEAPRLARQADAPLPARAVVTIEPGIYVPGWGGVRIEDDVHLAASGPEVLTHFTRELLELT